MSSEFGCRAVRVVGGVQHLLRGDLAVEVEQVEAAPDGGVEEDALEAAETSGETGHVGDARVRDDELHAFVAPDQRLEILGDRRKAAAAVDEDRHRSLDREREHRLKPLVTEGERLRSRMQLDAARAEIEAAPCLLERRGREIEADERDEPPLPIARRARASGRWER